MQHASTGAFWLKEQVRCREDLSRGASGWKWRRWIIIHSAVWINWAHYGQEGTEEWKREDTPEGDKSWVEETKKT